MLLPCPFLLRLVLAASLPMSKHAPANAVDAASQKSDASAALLMKSLRSVQRSGIIREGYEE